MLSFAEEIYLLALDEDNGKIIPDMRNPVLGITIIAAILVELAFLDKISTDKEHLYRACPIFAKGLIISEINLY
jgi:golgi phosphoprotein 3